MFSGPNGESRKSCLPFPDPRNGTTAMVPGFVFGSDSVSIGMERDSFCSQQQQQQQQPMSYPQSLEKADRHRKRHIPVGPAGIWFQRNKRKKALGKQPHDDEDDYDEDDGKNPKNKRRDSKTNDDDEEDDGKNVTIIPEKKDKSRRPRLESTFSSSPAWTAMQCDLGWNLPALPSHLISERERYNCLRPFVPSEFWLILDVAEQSERLRTWKVGHLMAVVEKVVCHHWLLWSVILLDETGAHLQAWLDPFLVQEEQQHYFDSLAKTKKLVISTDDLPNPTNENGSNKKEQKDTSISSISQFLQEGYVWHLVDCSVILRGGEEDWEETEEGPTEKSFSHKTKGGGLPERLLMVGKQNIRQVWTPEDMRRIPNDVFCAWLEKKNSIAIDSCSGWPSIDVNSPCQISASKSLERVEIWPKDLDKDLGELLETDHDPLDTATLSNSKDRVEDLTQSQQQDATQPDLSDRNLTKGTTSQLWSCDTLLWEENNHLWLSDGDDPVEKDLNRNENDPKSKDANKPCSSEPIQKLVKPSNSPFHNMESNAKNNLWLFDEQVRDHTKSDDEEPVEKLTEASKPLQNAEDINPKEVAEENKLWIDDVGDDHKKSEDKEHNCSSNNRPMQEFIEPLFPSKEYNSPEKKAKTLDEKENCFDQPGMESLFTGWNGNNWANWDDDENF